MKRCKDGRKNNVIPDYAKDVVANKRKYVDLPPDTAVVRSTDKAYLLRVDGKEHWCPKSMVVITDDIKRVAEFIYDKWSDDEQ